LEVGDRDIGQDRIYVNLGLGWLWHVYLLL